MGRPARSAIALVLFVALAASAQTRSPEQRAIDYLIEAVSRWPAENGCFSCHNNADAVRALYIASKFPDLKFNADVLGETEQWLSEPSKWKEQGVDAGFRDTKLAVLQFSAALALGVDSGRIAAEPLSFAARLLAADQDSDGAWRIEGEAASVGSPVTWGTALATAMARFVLLQSGEERDAAAASRAESWLLAQEPTNVPETAALLMNLDSSDTSEAREKRNEAVVYLLAARTSAGVWGPYPKSPPEVFDTAVATMALSLYDGVPERRAVLEPARAYLLETQLAEGGWPETTRPSGFSSYAQHVSTSAWATMALLALRAPK